MDFLEIQHLLVYVVQCEQQMPMAIIALSIEYQVLDVNQGLKFS
jgi:hypothetical protein